MTSAHRRRLCFGLHALRSSPFVQEAEPRTCLPIGHWKSGEQLVLSKNLGDTDVYRQGQSVTRRNRRQRLLLGLSSLEGSKQTAVSVSA